MALEIGAAREVGRVLLAIVGWGEGARREAGICVAGEAPRDEAYEFLLAVLYWGLMGLEVCARGRPPALEAAYGFGDTAR